jgi:hypothetical protein
MFNPKIFKARLLKTVSSFNRSVGIDQYWPRIVPNNQRGKQGQDADKLQLIFDFLLWPRLWWDTPAVGTLYYYIQLSWPLWLAFHDVQVPLTKRKSSEICAFMRQLAVAQLNPPYRLPFIATSRRDWRLDVLNYRTVDTAVPFYSVYLYITGITVHIIRQQTGFDDGRDSSSTRLREYTSVCGSKDEGRLLRRHQRSWSSIWRIVLGSWSTLSWKVELRWISFQLLYIIKTLFT